jgi:hypothetical protein
MNDTESNPAVLVQDRHVLELGMTMLIPAKHAVIGHAEPRQSMLIVDVLARGHPRQLSFDRVRWVHHQEHVATVLELLAHLQPSSKLLTMPLSIDLTRSCTEILTLFHLRPGLRHLVSQQTFPTDNH